MHLDQEPDSTGEFEAVVVDDGPRPRVVVRGELDLSTADEFAAALNTAFEKGTSVEIDAGSLTFVDSSGLRVLLEAQSRGDAAHPALVLVDPTPAVIRVFELAGVADLFQIRRSPDT